MNNNTKNTPTDYKALRDKLRAANYDPATYEKLARLLDVMEAARHSLGKVAPLIGISTTVLSRIIGGTYPADNARPLGLIESYLAKQADRRMVAEAAFVETEIAKRVWQAIDYSQTYQEIVSVIGKSQWGKTTAAEEYRRRKLAEGSEDVIILPMPVAPTPAKLAEALLEQLGVRTEHRKPLAAATAECRANLSARHVIIVDEVHQAADAARTGIKCIDWLRWEIFDKVHCGLVLIGTDVWGGILKGNAMREWQGRLAQTALRGIDVNLPPRLGYSDERAIWQSFGLMENPTDDVYAVLHGITSQYGLGRYVKRLRNAATAAARKGVPLTWGHVMAVHEQLEQLAGRK